MNLSSLALTKDLVSPWSFPALILVTLFLVVVTVWTYRGVRGSTNRRVGTVLGLRLTALVLALLMILRPSLAYREELRVPSTLLVVPDGSESMSIQDEAGPRSRWEAMLRILRQAEPVVQKLHDEHATVLRWQVLDWAPTTAGFDVTNYAGY